MATSPRTCCRRTSRVTTRRSTRTPRKSGKPQIDKAKEELAACGQPNGFDTVIATRNSGKEPESAEALQAALKNVGINATHRPERRLELYYRATVGSPSNALKKGYGLIMRWLGRRLPDRLRLPGRHRRRPQDHPAGGNNNYRRAQRPDDQRAIDQAKAETDPTKAAADWGQINKQVMDAATYLPFVYDKALNYRNPRMTNVFVNGYYGMVDFSALGVSGS